MEINSRGSAVATYPLAKNIRAIYSIFDPTPLGGASCSGIAGFAELQPFGNNDHVAGATGSFYGPTLLQAKYVAEGAASAPIIYNGFIIMNVSSKYSYAAARVGGIDNQANSGFLTNVKIASWREIF